MASLDFINDSSKAYAFIWRYRSYIFKSACAALFIKIFCILISFASGSTGNTLRAGIFLLPSYVVEAMFLVSLMRFYLYAEPIHIWRKAPVPPQEHLVTEKRAVPLMPRKTAIKAGIAIYLLIKIALEFTAAVLNTNVPDNFQTVAEPSLTKAVISMLILSALFWAVRLFWLYVPVSLGFSNKLFIKKIAGAGNSLYFLGVFILCSLPLLMFYSFCIGIIDVLLNTSSGIGIVAAAIVQSIFVLTIFSLQSLAVAHGVYGIMTNQREK